LKDFEYTAVATVDEAVSLLAARGDKARILAGGTDILVHLREGGAEADLVIDIKRVPELTRCDYDPRTGLQLGASTPCYRITGDEAIDQAYSALTDSARIIGGWQIQSRASIGGNLCNSSPAADSVPSLMVYGVTCQINGPDGSRSVPVAEFCTGPGKNLLKRGELLVRLDFPAPTPHGGAAYLRFIPRNEMDIAVVGAASWVQLNEEGDTIQEARIALCAVAPTPVFAQEASEWLSGQSATPETFAEAGRLAQASASPISDMRGPAEYRTHLVGVLTKRTLDIACRRARGEELTGHETPRP
jgi:carbon-monoxide dehydrogenase medium subunit